MKFHLLVCSTHDPLPKPPKGSCCVFWVVRTQPQVAAWAHEFGDFSFPCQQWDRLCVINSRSNEKHHISKCFMVLETL